MKKIEPFWRRFQKQLTNSRRLAVAKEARRRAVERGRRLEIAKALRGAA